MQVLSWAGRAAVALLAWAAAAPLQASPFVYVTNQDDNSVSVIDTESNSVVATVPVGAKPYSAVVSRDNSKVYVANFNDNSVSVIDAYTNTVTATLANLCTNPMYVALMPDGSQVWVACFNGAQLKRIDVASDTVVATISGHSRPSSIAFSPDGTRAYVALNASSAVRIINTATNATVRTMTTGSNTVDVFAAPDGVHVYSTANGVRRIWDSILQPDNYNWYDLSSPPLNLVMSPSGSHIYTTANDGNVWRIRVGQWSGITAVDSGGGPSGIDITGDGGRLYVTNTNDNSVSVIDTASYSRIATIPVGRKPLTYGRFVAKGSPPANSPPDPPTGVVATAGIAQVSVAFTPPVNTGGRPVFSYTAHCGTQSTSGTASPLLVTGLTNGVAVTCTVIATNSAGDSQPSASSAPVTPSAVLPQAPRNAQISLAGSGEVSLSFDPPAFDGGAAIIEYKATCGNVNTTGSASPLLVSGLANGQPVSCSVAAANEIGTGPSSAPTNTVTPGVAPAAPTSVSAVAGDRQLSVSFTAGDDGGFAVSHFHVACGARSVDGLQSPLLVTGLSNGVAVSCTVTATNTRGTSPPSEPSAPVTPAAVPDAPVIGVATRVDAQVSVSFTPGKSDGGAAVTLYRASCGTQTGEAAASPVIVSGLANGVAVSCQVRALNMMGSSAPSAASNSVTPAGRPGAPRNLQLSAAGLDITLDFQAPEDNGGDAISGYRAVCGAREANGAASPLTLSGMPAGVAVSCALAAQNSVGEGATATSNTVTPRGAPAAPGDVVATRGDGEVSVAFSAPQDDGGSPVTGYLALCGAQSQDGTASPIVVGGLENGVAVSCVVIAFNTVGNSPPSAASNSVTPAGVPGAPQLSSITGGDGVATLVFLPPASDNGAAISGYTASCTPGTHSVTGTQSPLSVAGLSNGTQYQCSLRAGNAVGSGAASPALAVTPRAVADLAISNSNGVDFLVGGEVTEYLIVVSHHGGAAVSGARVLDRVQAPLGQASWTCTGQGGGLCPASGSGDIDALVDLPAGASVSFLLRASVARLPETAASNTATVTAPDSIGDPVSANDSASDGPDSVGIFRSHFE